MPPIHTNHSTAKEVRQARREDAAYCATLVEAEFSSRPVFRFAGVNNEISRIRKVLKEGMEGSSVLTPTRRELERGEKDLRGEKFFLRYTANCCKVFTLSGVVTAEDLRANRRLREATFARIKLQYKELLRLGIAPSLIGSKVHRYSLAEAARRVELCKRLFSKSESTAPLAQTAIYRLFSGSYTSPSDAYGYYRKQLALCMKRLKGPDYAPLARTAAFLIFGSRFRDFADADRCLKGSFKEARKVFGADPGLRPWVRTAARAVFLGRARSVAEFKERFDAVAPETKRIFEASDETKPIAGTALHLVLMKKYPSPAEALRVYRRALRESKVEFAKFGEDFDLSRTAARMIFEKHYPDAVAAAGGYWRCLAEAELHCKGRLIEHMVPTVAFAAFSGRFSSTESAAKRLEGLLRRAEGRTDAGHVASRSA